MKVICTTSDQYLHILPTFCYLFNKFWSEDQQVEIVGYKKPNFELPSNFNFFSLGEQVGDKKNFTRDLRKYFAKQDKYFIWLMEDCFLRKQVNMKTLNLLKTLALRLENIGRVNLSKETMSQDHFLFTDINGINVYENGKFSIYRLSTQASIWNKHFVLQYMVNDLTPWEFECQADLANDEFRIIGLDSANAPIVNNEGVRKHNIFKFDLNNIPQEFINDMLSKGVLKRENIS